MSNHLQLIPSPVEERLIECVRDGLELDLTATDSEATEDDMHGWGAERTIRAAVIRRLVRAGGDSDPRGIRLRGARIDGRLDLRQVDAVVPLSLSDCYLPSGADLSSARLQAVTLQRCLIEESIDLAGAQIDGVLDLAGSTVRDDHGAAINSDGLRVAANLVLNEAFSAVGPGALGAVNLIGATVGGELDASGAQLRNDSGPALGADRLKVGQALVLGGGFSAVGSPRRPPWSTNRAPPW